MDRDHQPARIALARHIRLLQARGVGHGPRVRSAVPRAAEPISNSEGGSAPLPVLPPKTSCAGEAGARNGTGLGGGLRPPSEPPPKNKLRRRSRRSERNTNRSPLISRGTRFSDRPWQTGGEVRSSNFSPLARLPPAAARPSRLP